MYFQAPGKVKPIELHLFRLFVSDNKAVQSAMDWPGRGACVEGAWRPASDSSFGRGVWGRGWKDRGGSWWQKDAQDRWDDQQAWEKGEWGK